MSENNTQKTVLAIDTALNGVSVGVIASNGHVVSRQIETARGQAAILVPTIQEVIAEAKSTFKDVDLITCTKGPGSFTGLRIGLSTARTLGLALDIPVIGLNTLDVMARHYISPNPQAEGRDDIGKPLLVVLETKRQDFYARYYDAKGEALGESFAANADLVMNKAPKEEFVVGGDCLERFSKVTPCAQARGLNTQSESFELLEEWTQLDPILVAQMGLEAYEFHGDQGAPQPLYLRGADVSMSKKTQRVLEKLS